MVVGWRNGNEDFQANIILRIRFSSIGNASDNVLANCIRIHKPLVAFVFLVCTRELPSRSISLVDGFP